MHPLRINPTHQGDPPQSNPIPPLPQCTLVVHPMGLDGRADRAGRGHFQILGRRLRRRERLLRAARQPRRRHLRAEWSHLAALGRESAVIRGRDIPLFLSCAPNALEPLSNAYTLATLSNALATRWKIIMPDAFFEGVFTPPAPKKGGFGRN